MTDEEKQIRRKKIDDMMARTKPVFSSERTKVDRVVSADELALLNAQIQRDLRKSISSSTDEKALRDSKNREYYR